MKILVTGGSGMVGSELKKLLPNATYPTSKELNLADPHSVESFLKRNQFNYVIHLAAHVGSLHDNIENSTLYFDQNILINTIITKLSHQNGIKNFLGILSTCIYPDDLDDFPIKEKSLHLGAPHKDLMTYAYAKRSHAVQLNAYKESFNINYNYLIPCNLYGDFKLSHKDRYHFVNDLILKIIKAKRSEDTHIKLFGDGTPMRQFMLAEDFAKIICAYLDKDLNTSFNVAPEENLSINEIAKIGLEACEAKELKIIYDPSKPNGQFRKDVDTSLLKQNINFEFTSLFKGINKVYESAIRNNLNV
tara:strand:- start:666 stop:1577 length:912 start_codon:yes stop_codon:yes gene_type:complete